MAVVVKGAGATGGAAATVYTVGAGKQARIVGIEGGDATYNFIINDGSTDFQIVADATAALPSPIYLEAGHAVKSVASEVNTAWFSFLEQDI